MFCTKLAGKDSWFLPFNKRKKGYKGWRGQSAKSDGITTDYLWKGYPDQKQELSRIIENYAQVVVDEDPDTKKKTVKTGRATISWTV